MRDECYGHVLRSEEEYVVCGEESDGDRGVGEKKEEETKAEVVVQHQERLVGERIGRGGIASWGRLIRNMGPMHVNPGKDAAEEEVD